jgi:hypothetical protein
LGELQDVYFYELGTNTPLSNDTVISNRNFTFTYTVSASNDSALDNEVEAYFGTVPYDFPGFTACFNVCVDIDVFLKECLPATASIGYSSTDENIYRYTASDAIESCIDGAIFVTVNESDACNGNCVSTVGGVSQRYLRPGEVVSFTVTHYFPEATAEDVVHRFYYPETELDLLRADLDTIGSCITNGGSLATQPGDPPSQTNSPVTFAMGTVDVDDEANTTCSILVFSYEFVVRADAAEDAIVNPLIELANSATLEIYENTTITDSLNLVLRVERPELVIDAVEYFYYDNGTRTPYPATGFTTDIIEMCVNISNPSNVCGYRSFVEPKLEVHTAYLEILGEDVPDFMDNITYGLIECGGAAVRCEFFNVTHGYPDDGCVDIVLQRVTFYDEFNNSYLAYNETETTQLCFPGYVRFK